MKNTRPYPKHYLIYLNMAKSLDLPCPEGVALYVCNRIANGDWWYLTDDRVSRAFWAKFVQPTETRISIAAAKRRMQKIKKSTAERWLKHWDNGGSIRNLRPHTQVLAENRAKYKEWRKKYKDEVKRRGGNHVQSSGSPANDR